MMDPIMHMKLQQTYSFSSKFFENGQNTRAKVYYYLNHLAKISATLIYTK